MKRTLWIALWLSISLWAGVAGAHAARQSFVLLDIQDSGVLAELRLPLSELGLALKHPMKNEGDQVVGRYGQELTAYVTKYIQPRARDGRPWTVEVKDMTGEADDAGGDLLVHVWMVPPPGASTRSFLLEYDVISQEVVNHVALVSIRSDWNNGVFSDKPELVGAIRYLRKSVSIERAQGGAWGGFRGVVHLGMQHIAEGTDHLLFLLVLLLPAPLVARTGRWAEFGGAKYAGRRLLWTVTAFTIGHSLTLLAGALGLVRLSARPVEILIAVSILVSAVHAIRPLFPGRERWVAGSFGLVHGLAFASAIADLGLDPFRLALAVFGFNLGIEAMQLAVVLLSAPWLILLATTRFYSVVRVGGALFAAAASLAWIGQRAWGWRNPLDATVTRLGQHGLALVSLLAAAALIASVVGLLTQRLRARRYERGGGDGMVALR